MKTALPLCSLAALLLGAACSGSDEGEPVLCAPPSQPLGLQQRPQPFLVAGVPAALKVFADPTRGCGTDGSASVPPRADTVTAQVHGPDNVPVPSEIQLSAERDFATLHFTPPVTGSYHVLAAFTPVGSVQQLELLAGVERRPGPVLTELPVPGCYQLERTRSGTWLCDAMALRPPRLESQVLGTVAKVAAAGNVVWVVELGSVHRYVDTGTALELTGTVSLEPPHLDSYSRLATPDELVTLDAGHLHRITFTEGQGLTAHPPYPWPDFPRWNFDGNTARGMLLRAGARVLRIHLERANIQSEPFTQVCPFQLGAQGGYAPVEEPCQVLPGDVVGREPDALWTRTRGDPRLNAPATLHRWGVREQRLVEQGSLPLSNVAILSSQAQSQGYFLPRLVQVVNGGPVARAVWDEARATVVVELLGDFPLGLDPRMGHAFTWLQDSRPGAATVQVFSPSPEVP